MVEDVEDVNAELDSVLLLNVPVFGQLCIHVRIRCAEAGTATLHVAWEGSEGIADQRETIRVENLRPVSI